MYNNLVPANEIAEGGNYHFFKVCRVTAVLTFQEGIKPLWEDDANKHGGKWVVALQKGHANIAEMWLNTVCTSYTCIVNEIDALGYWRAVRRILG